MTIDGIIANTEALDFDKIIQDSVSETIEELKNYQQQQMYFGQDSQGRPIQRLDGKYAVYAPLTEFLKVQKGQPIDRVTLRDTGSFYRGIQVRAEPGRVVINSNDEKQASLINQYGDTILGLNAYYSQLYSENDLSPLATRKIKEQILR